MYTIEDRVQQLELDLKELDHAMRAHDKECAARHATLDERIRTLFQQGRDRGRLLWVVLATVIAGAAANIFFG